ncbi:MAG: aminotransferase class I/II-fold pyridoxal phosphate-dependent enzyme, partial [Myxococcota bacterium]
MFSRRSHVPEEETSLSRAFRDAKREAHRGDRMLADLTQSNPTLVGLDLPEQEVLEALQDPRIMGYRPSPFGEQEARCAVADELGRCWEDVVLTSSTSESYAALLTLLCDPGDRVLIPNPGYPLIAVLIKNLGLVPVPYPVCWDGQWHIPELAHSLMTG